jgi:hypothetical protein
VRHDIQHLVSHYPVNWHSGDLGPFLTHAALSVMRGQAPT